MFENFPAKETENKPEKIISLKDASKALDCRPRTLIGYLHKFGIPLSELSERKRGVLESDYRILLGRIRGKVA